MYVRYSEIILKYAQEILRVRFVFFVALHVVLDHLVLHFNNNGNSQVNMGYRENNFSFMVQNVYGGVFVIYLCHLPYIK